MPTVQQDPSDDNEALTYQEVDIFIVGGSVLFVIFLVVIWLLFKMSQEEYQYIEQDRVKHEHICWHGFLKKLQEHYRQKHEEELIRINLKDCSSYSVIPKSSTSHVQQKSVVCEEYDPKSPLCKAVSLETIKEFPARRNISRSLGATMSVFKDGQYSKFNLPPVQDKPEATK